MRHYDRGSYRHLDDSQRYRDLEYLADDAWIGPNEREAQVLVRQERRAQQEGFSIDERTEPMRAMPRRRMEERPSSLWGEAASFGRRVVRGIFHGKGPKNWVRSDARVYDDVCGILARDPEIDASDIEVAVNAGEVTLSGTVDSRRTKRRAEDVLGDVLGVIDVHNRLTVRR